MANNERFGRAVNKMTQKILNAEQKLQTEGYEALSSFQGSSALSFDKPEGQEVPRILYAGVPLAEHKLQYRVLGFKLLPDFLKEIDSLQAEIISQLNGEP
jgi:hypothetical protein